MPRPGPGLFTRERLIVYPTAILAISWVTWLLTIALGHPPAVLGGGPVLPDLLAYWTGGRLDVHGHVHELYDIQAQAAVQHRAVLGARSFSWFVAPPFVAWLYAPLALLPYGVAAIVFCCLSLVALAVVARLAVPLLPPRSDLPRRIFLLCLAAAPPVVEAVGSGQNSPLVLLLWVAALRCQLVDREAAAGCLLALTVFKPQLVLLMPVLLLLRRRWTALASFSATLVVLSAACLLGFGSGVTSQWLHTLSGGSFAQAVERAQSWKMESLSALVTTITNVDRLDVAMVFVGVVVLVRWARVTHPEPVRDLAMLSAVTLTLAPHVMLYDGVLLLFPVLWLARTARLYEYRWALLAIFVLQFSTAPRHLIAGLSPALSWLQWPWPALAITALTIGLLRATGEDGGELGWEA